MAAIRTFLILPFAFVAIAPSFAREDNKCYSSCRALRRCVAVNIFGSSTKRRTRNWMGHCGHHGELVFQCPSSKKLGIVLRKAAQEGKDSEPNDRDCSVRTRPKRPERAPANPPKTDVRRVTVPIRLASALVIPNAMMIAGIAKLKICTPMASSIQPPKHAQKVRFSSAPSSRYHPVGLS
jgi:hypothetical protein